MLEVQLALWPLLQSLSSCNLYFALHTSCKLGCQSVFFVPFLKVFDVLGSEGTNTNFPLEMTPLDMVIFEPISHLCYCC